MAKEPANPLLEDGWEEISTGIGEEWEFDKKGPLVAVYKGTEFVDIPEDKRRPNEDGTVRDRAMTYQYVIPDTGEIVFLWESYQLTEAMKEVEEGEVVRVIFDGYRKFDSAKGPRQVKMFKVARKKK